MCGKDGIDWQAFEAQAILPLLDTEQWDDALATCLEAYREAIYRYVVRMLEIGGESDPESRAEEILLDTFLTAWRRFATFGRRSTVRVWLFGIAIHILRNFQRQQLRHIHLEQKNFDRILDNVVGTWLVEEIPRTPTLASKWRQEIYQHHTAQSWQELLAYVQPALKQLRRRSTFYHFLLEQHICEGRPLREIATTTGMRVPRIKRELAAAKALFFRLFVALASDPR